MKLDISGIDLNGGLSDIGQLSVSSNTGNVLGFSLTGDVLPEGEGTLGLLYFDPSYDGTDMCMSSEIVSAYEGNQIESTDAGCIFVSPGEGAFPGDANIDGSINILDVVMIVNNVLNPPNPYYTFQDEWNGEDCYIFINYTINY